MPTRVVKVDPTKQVTIKLTPSSKTGGAMRVDLSGAGFKSAPQKRGPSSMKRGGALRAL